MSTKAQIIASMKAEAEKEKARTQDLSGGAVAQGMWENLWPSTKQFGKDFIQPFVAPVETGKALATLGSGIIELLKPGEHPDEEAARAVGRHFMKRYGGFDEIKRTLKTDPVGALADLSMVLSGGGTLAARAPALTGKVGTLAARAPGIAGKAGEAAQKVGTVIGKAGDVTQKVGAAIDPLSLVGRGVKSVGTGKLIRETLGKTTGVGGDAIFEAYKAGRMGGKQGEAFWRNLMDKSTKPETIVDMATSALDSMRDAIHAKYRAGMETVKEALTPIDFGHIEKALDEVADRGVYKGVSGKGPGIARNVGAKTVWDKIKILLEKHKALDPAEYHTPEGMDVLKQQIWNLKDGVDYSNAGAMAVIDQAYHAVRKAIADKAPDYDKTMKQYHTSMTELDDIRKTMSLPKGKRPNIDTAARKLHSALRNNVTTNFGRRFDIAKKMEEAGAGELMPTLAGQALSPWAPRGFGQLSLGGHLGLSALEPKLLFGLPIQSPKLVGLGAGTAGALSRIGPTKARAATRGLYQSGRLGREEE